jgi:hypothetical protein
MQMYGKVQWVFEVFFWLHRKAENFDTMIMLLKVLGAPISFAIPFFFSHVTTCEQLSGFLYTLMFGNFSVISRQLQILTKTESNGYINENYVQDSSLVVL